MDPAQRGQNLPSAQFQQQMELNKRKQGEGSKFQGLRDSMSQTSSSSQGTSHHYSSAPPPSRTHHRVDQFNPSNRGPHDTRN